MYTAFLLLIVMLFAALNLYLGFATTVYLRGAERKGTFSDYLLFLVHRRAFCFDAIGDFARTHEDQPTGSETDEENTSTQEEADEPVVSDTSTIEDDAPAEHPVETALQQTTTEVYAWIQDHSELDAQLRAAIDRQDGKALQGSAASLNLAAREGLEKLAQAVAPLTEYEPHSPEFDSARIVVENLLATLEAEVNAALADLVGLNFGDEASPELTQKLIDAHDKVATATHGHRDRLVDALLAMIHCELNIENLSRHLRGDLQTGLAARAGFETAIAEWRAGNSDDEPASLVMFDVDQLGTLNHQHGTKVGDKVLASIAETTRRLAGDDCTATRVAGQQFVVLCTQSGAREATGLAERVRQTVEQTTFRHDEHVILVAVSAAVVEASIEDTVDVLLERMRTTVREAKSYGRNRTFLCEDEVPSPVVPMEVSISPSTHSI